MYIYASKGGGGICIFLYPSIYTRFWYLFYSFGVSVSRALNFNLLFIRLVLFLLYCFVVHSSFRIHSASDILHFYNNIMLTFAIFNFMTPKNTHDEAWGTGFGGALSEALRNWGVDGNIHTYLPLNTGNHFVPFLSLC